VTGQVLRQYYSNEKDTQAVSPSFSALRCEVHLTMVYNSIRNDRKSHARPLRLYVIACGDADSGGVCLCARLSFNVFVSSRRIVHR